MEKIYSQSKTSENGIRTKTEGTGQGFICPKRPKKMSPLMKWLYRHAFFFRGKKRQASSQGDGA